MTLSPFVRDTVERASKSFAGGFATYLFEGVIASNVAWLHALEFGVGTAAVSPIFSLVSRHIGRKGTASVLKVIEYDK